MELVSTLVAHSDAAADRLAEATMNAIGNADPLIAVHHVMTRARFRKGPRANFPLEQAERTLRPFVDRGAPLPAVTFGFPMKLHYNGLKSTGFQPDLSEIGALVRLRELQRAVRRVYPPGLELTVLTDGDHFEPRPADLLRAYHDKLAEYHELVGGKAILAVEEAGNVAQRQLGAGIRDRRTALIADNMAALDDVLAGIDVLTGPFTALDRATERCAQILGNRGDDTAMPPFADLYRSLLYVVPVAAPPGTDQTKWSMQLYADIVNLVDPDVPLAVREARRDILVAAWRRTVRYLATLQTDRDLGCDDARLFPGRVRLTPNPGRAASDSPISADPESSHGTAPQRSTPSAGYPRTSRSPCQAADTSQSSAPYSATTSPGSWPRAPHSSMDDSIPRSAAACA